MWTWGREGEDLGQTSRSSLMGVKVYDNPEHHAFSSRRGQPDLVERKSGEAGQRGRGEAGQRGGRAKGQRGDQ